MDFIKLYQFLKAETTYSIDDNSSNLSIEKDLKIYGDDAYDLLVKYSKEFNVDISNFNFNKYFNSEIDGISLFILNLFGRKKKIDLTIKDLKEAIVLGKLE